MDLNFEVKTLVHFFFLYFWEFYFPVVIKQYQACGNGMKIKRFRYVLINKHK